ncbi:hypothetical protein SAMN05216436_10448 [bacterium A37T11]|nr:hypothetical protein SAMN05216436_10448 [bacterium A37T11]
MLHKCLLYSILNAYFCNDPIYNVLKQSGGDRHQKDLERNKKRKEYDKETTAIL